MASAQAIPSIGNGLSKHGIKIGTLSETDFDEWSAAWKVYIDCHSTELPPEQYKWTWAQIHDPKSEIFAFVARNADGKIIGLVHYLFHASTWSPLKTCVMNDIYVDPSTRGQGIGRALIEAAVESAKLKGARQIRWVTAHDNIVAQRLYDQMARSTHKLYNINFAKNEQVGSVGDGQVW